MNPASPSSPEALRARVAQGFGLLRQGRVDQAAQLRDQLRDAHEGNAEFHYYASEVCTAADELDDAHAHLVRANVAAPGQFELVLKQARVELALRRRDAFRHSATQAEQLAADDPQALWTLGRAWVACDDPIAAGRLFARARSLGCHDPALLCDLATTLLFERRIDEAERADAVLFFDEADALYAKRVDEVRDAQDRYANLDTSHLMTALENYPGIVLLASNLKANIDAAFLRRIRHVVEFPKPDAAARLRIWQQVLAGLFGAEVPRRLGSELERLAGIEATGAVIKNAALSALFNARHAGRPVDLRLLGEMLARELAKEGAGLSTREIELTLGPRA